MWADEELLSEEGLLVSSVDLPVPVTDVIFQVDGGQNSHMSTPLTVASLDRKKEKELESKGQVTHKSS